MARAIRYKRLADGGSGCGRGSRYDPFDLGGSPPDGGLFLEHRTPARRGERRPKCQLTRSVQALSTWDNWRWMPLEHAPRPPGSRHIRDTVSESQYGLAGGDRAAPEKP